MLFVAFLAFADKLTFITIISYILCAYSLHEWKKIICKEQLKTIFQLISVLYYNCEALRNGREIYWQRNLIVYQIRLVQGKTCRWCVCGLQTFTAIENLILRNCRTGRVKIPENRANIDSTTKMTKYFFLPYCVTIIVFAI